MKAECDGGPLCLLFATSGHSGVDRVVANLLPEFGKTDEWFDLVTIRGHGPHPAALPANVRHIQFPVGHRNMILPWLVRYLRRERPRALLTANHPLNRAALLARVVSRVPVHVTIRMGMSLSGRAHDMAPGAARRMFRSMRRWYPLANAAVAPSSGVGADLEALAGVMPERVHVIPNPIVSDALDRAAAEALNHPWFAPGEPPVILGAGSLEPRKDFATLVRAFARLRSRRPARLVILGEGRERDALQRVARELGVAADVDLPGYADNPYRWMARAAVFVLCSRREGSGAVLVEALACRTPVVATDCHTGPAEILDHGRLGPLVPVGDDTELTAALERVLDRPVDGASLREGVTSFRVDAAARQYLRAMGVDAGVPT